MVDNMKRASIAFTVWFVLIFYGACGLVDTKKEHVPDIPGKIVFSMREENGIHMQIFVANTDGSDRKQITHLEKESAMNPSWSPDGKQIVFLSTKNSTTLGFPIYIMDADGSNMRPMSVRSPKYDLYWPGSYPKWSPDGRKIAFYWCVNCELGGGNSEIFIYDFETDSVTPLAEHPAADQAPRWSPDGQYLTFTSNRDYYYDMDDEKRGSKRDLYAYNFADQKLRRVTTNGIVSDVVWSPDSKSILIGVPDPPFEIPAVGKHWFYLDPANGDTLGTLSLNTHLNSWELSPVKWSVDQQVLMLVRREERDRSLYFYDFRTDSLYESIDFGDRERDGFGSVDWYIGNK